MNSRSSQSHSSRRGGRNRSDNRSSRAATPPPPPAPKTLWQKVTSLFSRPPAKVAPTFSKPTVHPANAPARRSPERDRDRERSPERDRDRERPSDRAAAPAANRVSRKPEMVEVTTPRLYVGNLSFDAAENDLSELFNGVGQVVSVEVVTHKQTQRSKGFAFVQMAGVDEAKRAVLELHDKEFLGRKLVVSGAKNADDKERGGESSQEE